MDNQTPLKLFFRVFRAIDDEQACQRFFAGHMEVLKIFGITQITTAKTDWMYNPNTYVILVESEDGQKSYGGSRIHIAGNEFPLPIEEAIGKMDNNIYRMVKDSVPFGAGEFCGLWNSREVAGMGIGTVFLGRASVAVASMLNVNKLFGLCAPTTYPNSIKIGYETIISLGMEGKFYYPKEDLLATSLIIHDVANLPTAFDEDREYINSLRNKPIQYRKEKYKLGDIEIQYDLTVNKKIQLLQ